MGRTPFYRTSNKLKHQFSNIERTKTCSSVSNQTRPPFSWLWTLDSSPDFLITHEIDSNIEWTILVRLRVCNDRIITEGNLRRNRHMTSFSIGRNLSQLESDKKEDTQKVKNEPKLFDHGRISRKDVTSCRKGKTYVILFRSLVSFGSFYYFS